MDPFSLLVGCVGLISAIKGTTSTAESFIVKVRQARSDLDPVTVELISLTNILEFLVPEGNSTAGFPRTLAHHLQGIVVAC